MRFPTFRRVALVLGVALGLGLAGCGEKIQSHDTLVIGMTQYPATLNPNIESMLAKTYVLAMTQRPFTHHDADWKLVCALCETLPTLENGLAVPEPLPNGKKGVAVPPGMGIWYCCNKLERVPNWGLSVGGRMEACE